MATRNYMSIGEVLVALKAEFPDVTISKIRFLEGEGLLDPERTPSGYRKFYKEDVDRLRQVLRMQRDEYLPLKVIKERLEQKPDDPKGRKKVHVEERDEGLAPPATGLQMSVDELAAATGVDPSRIQELESFGIVCSHGLNGNRYYDGDDFLVVSIAKDFFKYGIEARHLAMYRHFAEREATFFEQLVMPMLRQKNPDSRRTAVENLTDLTALSRKLKQALLTSNLRQYLQA
ncbi:MAG: MerR family transcriptional regulator [Actinomycetota bacterium]|nr:MerR family transcriptional regulator [Actinomycetota bacterium]